MTPSFSVGKLMKRLQYKHYCQKIPDDDAEHFRAEEHTIFLVFLSLSFAISRKKRNMYRSNFEVTAKK